MKISKANDMKKSNPNIKTKLIYGVIVIIPLAIITIVLVKVIELLEIVAKAIGIDSSFGAGLTIILALVFLLLVCYVVGALVHTKIGAWSFGAFEEKLLLQIPGYRIISNVLKGFAEEETNAYQPALIQLGLPGTSVLGFVMDENHNDTLTVFVPSIPAITIGALYIVERSRVTLLDISHLEIVNCMTEWGMGSNKFIGKEIQNDPA